MSIKDVIPEVAHQMALLPVLWLAVRREQRPEWWWLAGAFAVSWIADFAAHYTNPWLPAAVYPISQVGIIATVFLARRDAALLVAILAGIGVGAIWWQGVRGPDVLLQVVASASVVGIAWQLPMQRLRLVLLVAFGGGAIAWLVYVIAPGWATWGLYQAVRASSLGLFCWANLDRAPHLRLA